MTSTHATPTLCPYELNSFHSLATYIAQNQNLQESHVEAMACARFNVARISDLRHEDFRNVIAFLMDLKMGEIRD